MRDKDQAAMEAAARNAPTGIGGAADFCAGWCARATHDEKLREALADLTAAVTDYLVGEYPEGHQHPADRAAKILSHANVIARAALAARVPDEGEGEEAEALCPDRWPCRREDEWGHPCPRNERGDYECERAIAALREGEPHA